jgi:hypothetical protein
MNISRLLPFCCVLLCLSCDFSHRIDTSAAVKEMKSKQVKRVLPEQIVSQVDTWGQALEKNPKALPAEITFKTYQGPAEMLIQQVSDKKLKDVLDAISYSLSQKQVIPPSIQKNAAGDSLFYIFQQANGETTLYGFSKSSVIQHMDRPLIK